jgi:hypothetical protein
MALQRTRRPRLRSGRSLCSLGSPLNAQPLGRLVLLLILVSIQFVAVGLEAGDGLIVHGSDWAFTVAEPQGWHGDIAAAAQYQANLVLFPESRKSKKSDVTIRIRVNEKTDESIDEDLRADMDEYRTKFSGSIQFAELDVQHPSYPLVAKTFYVPHEFFEYVAYANPGKEYPYVLSIAMSKAKKGASSDEMAAYSKVLNSIRFMRKAP